MRVTLNREVVVAALAFVVFLAGVYQVTVGIITPPPDIRSPVIQLRSNSREISQPRYSTFQAPEIPVRNPFSFSAGWQRLEALPLDPPPTPGPQRIVPVVRGSAGEGASGFLHTESLPREVKKPTGTSDAQEGE